MTKTPRASEAILGSLHDAVAQDLLRRISSGEATPAEINAAIKFLQNNGIECVMEEGSVEEKLLKSLPVFNDEDSDDPLYN